MIHNISRFIAALALALATGVCTKAGAKEISNVPYIDADGNEQTATYATVVTSDMGGTSNPNFSSDNGWYYVNSDVTLDGAYNTSTYTQNIILGDGATLTISGRFRFGYDSVNIYCQSGGTGKLVVSATYSNDLFYIGSNHTLTINGGTVEVTNQNYGNAFSGNLVMNGGTAIFNGKKGYAMYAIYGTVTLNGGTFTATSNDYASEGICSNYVTIADGKYFKDGSGNIYYGSLSNAQKNALNGVTLTPATQTEYIQACLGAGNDGSASKPYTISDAEGWDAFCLALQDNDTWNRFSGKTVRLGANITVTRMAGGDSHDFTGTFDGGGNTLTFTATDNYCAPFRHVQGASAETPAVISNLNVVSTVTADDYRHPAGLIAMQSGYVSVTDCNVEAHISNTKGTANPSDLYPAALVSQSNNTGVLTVSGCTTTGQIATDGKFAAGLVGIVQNTATIENCRASVTIQSTTSGDGTHGGLVASQPSKTTITITGCVFDGRLLGSATNCCGGFIGYRKGAAGIYNSLFAPTEVTVQNSGSATFARNDVDTHNCYYTYYLCDGEHYVPYYATDGITRRNGHATRTVTAATDVTIDAIALTGSATQYTVSGITAYSGGGLQRGQTLYYGSGDQLSLTLTTSAVCPQPGYQYTYTASAGTLSGSTLTMPDEDVTISVNTATLAPIDWATVNQGDSEDPFMIYNKDQLLLLAHRVNGTNGETANTYEGKYFKLGADITFSHDADETDDYAENYEAIGRYDGHTNRNFKGKFDGDGHTVSGIRIRKTDNIYQGLFGSIGSGADIHDVHLTDARITGYHQVGGIVGRTYGTVSGCSVTDSYITATSNLYYGTICGVNYGTLTNNYYHGCTVNGTAVTSGKGCQGADITANHGALPAYRLALGANITTPPGTFAGQTEWLDTPPVGARLAPENGFTLAGNHYFASGYEFTPGSTLASGAAQGYTPRATLGGQLLDLYTPTGDTDPLAGKAIARLTITADCDGKTLASTQAIYSTGQPVTVAYIKADGTPGEANAIALDGMETSLAAGWYFVGKDISYTQTLTLGGDVNLILADGKTMNIGTSGNRISGNGIAREDDGDQTLTIYGQNAGTGALNVYTGNGYNGILAKAVTINGGHVTIDANGNLAAGIFTINDAITINNGTVSATATGNNTWGLYANRNLTINGGNVNATGGAEGIRTDNGDITINGGNVSASGTEYGINASYGNGNITLGWTRPTDRITASSISAPDGGTVAVADGQALTDGSGHIYTGTLTASVLSGFAAETTLQPCLALADAADNIAAIDDHAGQTLAVALSGRTLYKDGSWNTLCLPFAVDLTASGTLSGDNVQAMTLNTTTSNLADGTLTLNFDDATGQTIPAGTPFIIKWDNTGVNIENPVFMGVTVSNATNDATVEGVLTFTGTYAPVPIPATGDNTKLYLGAANKLYYPTKAMTIGTHRAYFQLADGITAGNPTSGVRAFALNFGDDEATGIISVHDSGFTVNGSDAWYTLDGRRLDGQPTAKGLYIHGGKKVAIK